MASIKNRPKLAATQSKQAKNSTSPKATLQPFMQENIDRYHFQKRVQKYNFFQDENILFIFLLQSANFLFYLLSPLYSLARQHKTDI